ncbi:MAG: fluoride efflux transporter CrcB [Bacteroidetes bacterium]|nr:fluoride efflux transporter CrcB [Bacteroidota bacterium]
MARILLLIGTGGFIGSVLRYLLSTYLNKSFPSAFPYGTFIVNVLGCLLIGVVFGISEKYNWLTPEWRLFLTTGICGGFTTFSAFAHENMKLLQEGNFLVFSLYSIGSFSLGVLAVFAGLTLAKI